MSRPLLLDLFCGAGGAAKGYHDAGFDVIGIDQEPQPSYPFDFVQGDVFRQALTLVDKFEIAAVHASPPCQAYSSLAKRWPDRVYPDLIPATRILLSMIETPWVIENVVGAPLRDPVKLCGTMFPPLRVIRHRLFETSFATPIAPRHPKHPLVFTLDKRKAHHGKLDQDTAFVQVTGGGNCTIKNAREAMGINWMNMRELNQAIPPPYTEWVGRRLMKEVTR